MKRQDVYIEGYSSMKILHLLNTNRFSGAENVACQIINMFSNDENIEMIYVSLDGEIREALDEHSINFVPIVTMSVQEIRRVILQEKPDIIHAHDMRASFYAARACGKVPLISHIHNNNFDSRGVSMKSIAYLYAALKAKHIFWVSQSSFDGYAFHRFLCKKSSLLYNIIDIDALYEKMRRDTNKYDYDVVYIGRLTYQKNPQRLMKVLYLLKEKKNDIKVAIIGAGELEREAKQLAIEYDLLDNVSFLGFRSNPLKILHDSKVMLMTSRWEGTPMCALEAMALGVPIVGTPVDGLVDLLANDEIGYLSEDDDALAQAVIEIITDRNLREKYCSKNVAKAMRINNRFNYKSEIKDAYGKLLLNN